MVAAIALGGTALQARGQANQEALEARGATMYVTHCQTCHGDQYGIGKQLWVPTHGRDGHTWHHSDRNLKETILNGSAAMDPEMEEMMREMMGIPADAPKMPAWKGTLSEEDVDAVIAYIRTFWTPEQRRFQQEMPMMR